VATWPNYPEAAGHAFFYLRDPAWVETVSATERSTYVEDSPSTVHRLAELRERIESSVHPSSTYESPERVGDQLFVDFETLIDRLYPVGGPDDRTHPERASPGVDGSSDRIAS